MTHQIGLVQMNSQSNLRANLDFAHKLIKEAGTRGLSLISFPEMFLYIGESKAQKLEIAQTLEGPLVQQFQEYALQYDISIHMGSIYEKIPEEPDRLYNSSVLLGNQGEIVDVYRKIHLCDIDSPQLKNLESAHIKAGESPIIVDHLIGKIGLAICYDLRFPGLFQHLTSMGAEIIFVPSAFFMETGKDHWFPLLRARAIENQVYIVAPAQCGHHYGTRRSFGNSVLIDPWGTVLCCAPEYPCLITGEIDLEYLYKVRSSMPVLEHQRYEHYGIKK